LNKDVLVKLRGGLDLLQEVELAVVDVNGVVNVAGNTHVEVTGEVADRGGNDDGGLGREGGEGLADGARLAGRVDAGCVVVSSGIANEAVDGTSIERVDPHLTSEEGVGGEAGEGEGGHLIGLDVPGGEGASTDLGANSGVVVHRLAVEGSVGGGVEASGELEESNLTPGRLVQDQEGLGRGVNSGDHAGPRKRVVPEESDGEEVITLRRDSSVVSHIGVEHCSSESTVRRVVDLVGLEYENMSE
jgi:hypothetical protein